MHYLTGKHNKYNTDMPGKKGLCRFFLIQYDVTFELNFFRHTEIFLYCPLTCINRERDVVLKMEPICEDVLLGKKSIFLRVVQNSTFCLKSHN